MQRDLEALLDMLQASRQALGFVTGRKRESFMQDVQCQFAVVRAVEIIGEAARAVSEETRAEFPQVPWRDVIGMRNRMIHRYREVDLAVVWDTVQRDLPALIGIIEPLVPAEESLE